MALEFRQTVRADYSDVITDDAVRVMEGLARFDSRAQAGHGRPYRAAGGSRPQAGTHRLSRSERRHRAHVDQGEGRARGQLRRCRDPERPAAPVDSGDRPGRPARGLGRDRSSQRRLCPLERRRRMDVRWRGCAWPGVDDVARQPTQLEAGDSSRSEVHGGGRAGRRQK